MWDTSVLDESWGVGQVRVCKSGLVGVKLGRHTASKSHSLGSPRGQGKDKRRAGVERGLQNRRWAGVLGKCTSELEHKQLNAAKRSANVGWMGDKGATGKRRLSGHTRTHVMNQDRSEGGLRACVGNARLARKSGLQVRSQRLGLATTAGERPVMSGVEGLWLDAVRRTQAACIQAGVWHSLRAGGSGFRSGLVQRRCA